MIKFVEDVTLKIRALWNQFNAARTLLYLAYQVIDENKTANYKHGNMYAEGTYVKAQIKKFLNEMDQYEDYQDDKFVLGRWRIDD